MIPAAVAFELHRRAWGIRTRYEALDPGLDWANRGLTRMLHLDFIPATITRMDETANQLKSRCQELRGVMGLIEGAFRGNQAGEAATLLDRAEALMTLCEHDHGSYVSDVRRALMFCDERN